MPVGARSAVLAYIEEACEEAPDRGPELSYEEIKEEFAKMIRMAGEVQHTLSSASPSNVNGLLNGIQDQIREQSDQLQCFFSSIHSLDDFVKEIDNVVRPRVVLNRITKVFHVVDTSVPYTRASRTKCGWCWPLSPDAVAVVDDDRFGDSVVPCLTCLPYFPCLS